jgi:hypothetical protein
MQSLEILLDFHEIQKPALGSETSYPDLVFRNVPLAY